jgi:hypothetical protein
MCFGSKSKSAPTPQPAPVAPAVSNPNNVADTSNARQSATQPAVSQTATMLTQPSGQTFGADLGTGSPTTGAA